MNQFVAPTTFMISISRPRLRIALTMLVRMSRVGGEQHQRTGEEHGADLIGEILDVADRVVGGDDRLQPSRLELPGKLGNHVSIRVDRNHDTTAASPQG